MMCVSRYDQEMLRATDALRVQNWAGARTHFREAASSKMMDDVAVYGLYMAERLETETNLTEFEAAVKRGDFASARKVSDVETDPRRREVQIKVLERLTKNPE